MNECKKRLDSQYTYTTTTTYYCYINIININIYNNNFVALAVDVLASLLIAYKSSKKEGGGEDGWLE